MPSTARLTGRQRWLRSTPDAHQSEHIGSLIAHEVDRDVGEASRTLNWVNWSVFRSRSSMDFISATTSPPHQRTPGSMSGMRFDVSSQTRPNARPLSASGRRAPQDHLRKYASPRPPRSPQERSWLSCSALGVGRRPCSQRCMTSSRRCSRPVRRPPQNATSTSTSRCDAHRSTLSLCGQEQSTTASWQGITAGGHGLPAHRHAGDSERACAYIRSTTNGSGRPPYEVVGVNRGLGAQVRWPGSTRT